MTSRCNARRKPTPQIAASEGAALNQIVAGTVEVDGFWIIPLPVVAGGQVQEVDVVVLDARCVAVTIDDHSCAVGTRIPRLGGPTGWLKG